MKKIYFYTLLISMWGLSACSYDTLETPVDCAVKAINLSVGSVSPAHCGISDGAFTIIAAGNTTGLEFTLSGTAQPQVNSTFSGLAAGEYLVQAKNADGCTASISVTVQNENGVQLDGVEVEQAGCGASNGSISVSVSGGVAPYQYKLGNGTPQASNVFSSLPKGNYTVTITDASGCTTQSESQITSGVSFSATIAPIISTNCAISGCHNGSQSPNLQSFSNIKANAARIKNETQSRSMPQGRSLSQEQIDNIACWVDDGALDN